MARRVSYPAGKKALSRRHQMAIWEYLITTFSGKPENLSTWLNEQGKEGWELVHVEQPNYWFKRQEAMMGSRAA
jgi:hypothetical protein